MGGKREGEGGVKLIGQGCCCWSVLTLGMFCSFALCHGSEVNCLFSDAFMRSIDCDCERANEREREGGRESNE